MKTNLGQALALLILVGCPGCATTESDGNGTPPSRYKVTARVVDVAPGRPGTGGDSTAAVGSVAPGASPQPARSRAAQEHSEATKAPVAIGAERLPSEPSTGTAENPEPRRQIEPPLNPEEQFLLRVAAERPAVPLDGSVNGEPALVNFVSGDPQCSSLAITYPVRRVSEIWRVCADRRFVLERKAEPTPLVPEDPLIEPTRLMAVHSAYDAGHASIAYGSLTISAQAAGSPDARGCVLIRSALSWQGIPMATSDDIICQPLSQ